MVDSENTDTATQSTCAASNELRISFHEGISEEDRVNAESSIAALVARSRARMSQRWREEAELAELADAVNMPPTTLIDGDLTANTAYKLRTRRLIQPEALGSTPVEPLDASVLTLNFVPPYEFSWAWHDGGGNPPFGIFGDRFDARVGVDARSGSLEGGASGFVNAHVGFGVSLRSDVTKEVFPHAVLNPGRFSFATQALGLGSSATSEGGFELTVFEDGQFLVGASRKLWRKRVSIDESASGGDGPKPITGPELQFTIRAGRSYTFNAGIWAFSDRTHGVGAAAVQSLMEGNISKMWVFGLP